MGIASLDLDGRKKDNVFVNSLLRAPGKRTLRFVRLVLVTTADAAYFSALAVEATPRHCHGVLTAFAAFEAAGSLCGRSLLAE